MEDFIEFVKGVLQAATPIGIWMLGHVDKCLAIIGGVLYVGYMFYKFKNARRKYKSQSR